MSTSTGFINITWGGYPQGPVYSGYLNTRARNLCNHRDYQNIAVNGARSSSMASTIMQTFSRNQTLDQPAFVGYALIGNDVCNGHHTMETMTTPQEFYVNVINAMKYLDEILPPGSVVVFSGLVDGRILYDTMENRVHPLGALRGDVKYSDFYNFMNCLEISPCFGWMNTDEWWRNATTKRAMELNQVYQDIIANNTFQNFKMYYVDTPLEEVIAKWHSMGGQTYELIEPVDGFHPTQISDALAAEIYYEKYIQFGIAPPINPHNELIRELFGDQGGYSPE